MPALRVQIPQVPDVFALGKALAVSNNGSSTPQLAATQPSLPSVLELLLLSLLCSTKKKIDVTNSFDVFCFFPRP